MKGLLRSITFRWIFTLVVGVFVLSGQANASLTLTIDNYTTNEVTFTISGTFDTDTIGDSPGYLAIKNDWSNNQEVHTEWFSSTPTATLNTITIGGLVPSTIIQNDENTWTDNIFFTNPLGSGVPILAGTVVAGSVTLTAAGAFNPSDAATLELLSGFVRPLNADDWARLEGTTVIIPEADLAIPTMNEWGIIIFSLLVGSFAVWYMHKQSHKNSVA